MTADETDPAVPEPAAAPKPEGGAATEQDAPALPEAEAVADLGEGAGTAAETPDPEPAAPPPADPLPVDESHLRLAEALVFASAEPVSARRLSQVLPVEADPGAVIDALRARYAGRGVELVETGGGVMFRTAPDLAAALTRVIEVPRRLPRAAMEALAIVAYHQPVTRAEIEEIRGASLSQSTLDALLENGLVTAKGKKEVPGRPTLWGTTPAFLAQFGLKDLRELPKREELLTEATLLQATDAAAAAEEASPAEEEAPASPEAASPEAEASSAGDGAPAPEEAPATDETAKPSA